MPVTLKSSREIAIMRSAGQIVADVLDLMRAEVRPGVTTGALDRMVHSLILERGGVPSFLGYHGFPGSACTSVNEEIVHGIPGNRVLRDGDLFTIDVGVRLDGYHADSALTLPVGQVSDEAAALIEATEGAFFASLEFAREGSRVGDIASAVQVYAESRGYGLVEEFSGHGIGRELHEDPQIPNVGRAGTGLRLRSGMTVAIEPMLTIGPAETRTLGDGWTVVTRSGGLAAHYEHTVLITSGEPELLTQSAVSVI